MQEGKVNSALRLSPNNLSNWIIPVSYETLEKLNLKYPWAKQAHIYFLLNNQRKPMHKYKDINEFLVINGVIRTKARCRSSSLDTSNWHRLLVSNQFRSSTLHLWKSFAGFVESLYIANIHNLNLGFETCWEKFTARNLTPLKKLVSMQWFQ